MENNDVVKEKMDESVIFNFVNLLLPNPKVKTSRALRVAVEHGYIDIVKLLLPFSNPKAQESAALRVAVEHGYTDIVELLIPVSDLYWDEDTALDLAVRRRRTDIVQLLIPFLKKNEYDVGSLWTAVERGYTDIVKMLYPIFDPEVRGDDRLLDMVRNYGRSDMTEIFSSELDLNKKNN